MIRRSGFSLRAARIAVLCVATPVACGCTSLPSFPTLPPWQDISAEREARKQETLAHIETTREKAAEIEQASFAKEAGENTLTPPVRTGQAATADRLSAPGASPVTGDTTAPPTAQPSVEALRSAAQRAVALDDLDEAIRLYRELAVRLPDDAAIHHSLALVAERLNLHEEAAKHYLEAVRLAPQQSLYRLCWEAHADRLAGDGPVAPILR